MRLRSYFNFPLIPNLHKHIWIIYLNKLDFTAFVNYGGAWFEGREPDFNIAHNYDLDLRMENKGVQFKAGAGLGQTIGYDFDYYFTLGFNALL